jgi:uncharacterized protein
MLVYERHSALPHPATDALAYLSRETTFTRLLPPWERLRVVEQTDDAGGHGRIELRSGALRHRRWRVEIEGAGEARRLQATGPSIVCDYTQRVLPRRESECELIDHVECRLSADTLATFAAAGAVRRRLERLFAFRQARIRNDLDRHAVWAGRGPLTVAIAGAGGLVGAHLCDYLAGAGHRVLRLVRRPAATPDEIAWNPDQGTLDPAALEGVDAVVNLCGASLATIWTKRRKDALRDSRVRSTRTLAETMRSMERPPTVFVSASAVGFYGSRGDESLTEDCPAGRGFLADLCSEWEAAAQGPEAHGVRVVRLRFGLVLTASGGALATMLPVFRAGLGGRVGDGRQWWSWVALDDALGAVECAIHDDGLRGAVNVVAPGAVTNRDFTRLLARSLRRPALLEAPRSVVAALGGMPDEMLLASQRVVSARLRERGYRFAFPDLETALRFELGG